MARTRRSEEAHLLTPLERLERQVFARCVVEPTGCLIFQGSLRRGYGRIRILGKVYDTHRFAYEVLVGPIPDGMTIDHLCFEKRCCNVRHLEVVTQSENSRRGAPRNLIAAANRAKTHCPRGHGYTTENTIVRPDGSRACRKCGVAATKAWARRRRDQEVQVAQA